MCCSSTFCYEPHGHIITGDLRIVENRKLRRLLSKRPKYREENTIDWDLNKKILITAVDDYAKNWSKREGVPVSVLNEWSLTLKLIISNKINSFKKTKVKKFMQVLKDKHVVSAYIKDLHSKYVIVPADKAGNNIIFVCKYFYIKTLMDELGIDSTGNANGTYEAQHDTPDEVIKKHSETIEKDFKIKLTDEKETLPQMYWIPKLHKKPYKARFIAGSSSCTTTRLSKLITSCLKLVKSHCISYCKTIYDRTGVSAMWIINNSLDVIQMIGRKQFQATSVTTWDFSTLYTSIPHKKLKHRIHELLEKTYAVRRKSFIATDNFRTFWTDEKKCNRYHFSCRDLCRAIDFLIDNIFVRFGGKVFRQVIGIPMGTNSAPLLADLFLHTYEYAFIIKTMKGDITRALQLNKTFRYIDDLLCVNNGNFNKHINEIYPSELILKNTTTTPSEISYLDTTLNIGEGNGTVRISIYDKREDFNFKIVNFPYLDSNIPRNPAYGVYISQLVRYARICSRKDDFIYRHRRLSLKLQQQGYKYQQLMKSFHKFYRSHSDELKKFVKSDQRILLHR